VGAVIKGSDGGVSSCRWREVRAVPAQPGAPVFSHLHLHGGLAPVRRFLPELIELIWKRQIDPGKVFDLELPLDKAGAGYTAMDERRAIKVLLTL
jgi:threonine dehydrogenase-like Zn-dependent dehydrogenase